VPIASQTTIKKNKLHPVPRSSMGRASLPDPIHLHRLIHRLFFIDSIYLYNRSILRTMSTSFEILNLRKT
jgi:hypothetical protein